MGLDVRGEIVVRGLPGGVVVRDEVAVGEEVEHRVVCAVCKSDGQHHSA